jgi:tetratricopeptide (TPR) repeat protein
MKKILFAALLLLSLMACVTSPTWAGGLDDVQAGLEATNKGNYDKAIRLFTEAIASEELSLEDLSKTFYNRGFAWMKMGDDDNAIADFTEAIEIAPRFDEAFFNRGRAWHDKGDYGKAIVDYTKAIEIVPNDAFAYFNRGNSWVKTGASDKAIADYTKAIEIEPKFTDAYNNLAWLMATCPEGRYRDGKRAVELAEKAVKLEETPNRLNTLAAAYAEAGRFQEAIKTQERAITKLKQAGGTNYLPEYEELLSSYKAGNPWREK